MKRTLFGFLLAGVVASCAAEEDVVAYDTVYLDISLTGEVIPPTRLVARVMTHTNDGPVLKALDIDLTGIDIASSPYRVKLDVPPGSPFTSETILSVVAYHDDTPVASYAARPSLAEPGDMVVAMVPLTRQCDSDEDGFANCLAGAACCDKDQADYAHDCDDADPAIQPLATNPSCRLCDGTTVCDEGAELTRS